MFENVWWWIITISIAVVVFFVMLNGSLRGRRREHIDGYLGGVWLILLILSLVLFGWRMALIYFLGSFVFGALVSSASSRVAKRLMGRNK